ncbi:MAG: hypothetical protein GY807_07155 [Gammaproteobacteria bacterium]|nr:hypothetical protein [Gammaproteobacteria bacterium]
MIGKRIIQIICLITSSVWVMGCHEPPEVTIHEAGVYKGAKDPLLDRRRQTGSADELVKRFNLVQIDR